MTRCGTSETEGESEHHTFYFFTVEIAGNSQDCTELHAGCRLIIVHAERIIALSHRPLLQQYAVMVFGIVPLVYNTLYKHCWSARASSEGHNKAGTWSEELPSYIGTHT